MKAMNMRVKKASGRVVYMAELPAGSTASRGWVRMSKMGSTTVQQAQKPMAAATTHQHRRRRSSLRWSMRDMRPPSPSSGSPSGSSPSSSDTAGGALCETAGSADSALPASASPLGWPAPPAGAGRDASDGSRPAWPA